MPVISLISPKGGAGKTTTAVVLATELAAATSVILIDADPNQPVKAWAALGGYPDNLNVMADVNQDTIADAIEEASAKAAFVIVDCEGTASTTAVLAVGMSDFVLIPTKGSVLDAKQASRAIKIVRSAEKVSGRAKPHAILLTQTNPALKTKNLFHVAEELRSAGVPIMATDLNEREAFRSLFAFGGGLANLDPKEVSNIEKAQKNARELVKELTARIKSAEEGMAK